MDNEKLVKMYLKMRAAKSALTREYEAAAAAIDADMNVVGGMLHKTLLDTKSKSTKTDAGTFYLEKVQHARCEDWPAYHAWLIEQGTLDGLEKRVTKSFVIDYKAENDDKLPPGIVVQEEQVVRVRVPTK